MPIYEYRCADCRKRASLYYQTFSSASAATPTCPACGSARLTRLVSRVFQLKSEDAQLEDLGDDWSEMVDRLEAGEDLGEGDDLGAEGVGSGEDVSGADLASD